MMEILKQMGEMAGEAVLDSDTEGRSQGTRNCWARDASYNVECGEVKVTQRVYKRKGGNR